MGDFVEGLEERIKNIVGEGVVFREVEHLQRTLATNNLNKNCEENPGDELK